MKTELFDRLSEAGRRFLGVRYPFICGAMTWVSDPKLVAAVCNAGGFASLAAGNAPSEILEKQTLETQERMGPLIAIAQELAGITERTGREQPDVIT